MTIKAQFFPANPGPTSPRYSRLHETTPVLRSDRHANKTSKTPLNTLSYFRNIAIEHGPVEIVDLPIQNVLPIQNAWWIFHDLSMVFHVEKSRRLKASSKK